jgi:hypothetical protein
VVPSYLGCILDNVILPNPIFVKMMQLHIPKNRI